MKTSNVIKAFLALGHESRLGIYMFLMDKGEQGVPAGEVGKALEIPGATLSFHLTQLANARLIGSRREGRTIYYYVRYRRIKKLIKYLSGNLSEHLDESIPANHEGGDVESEVRA